jgi:DNA-binding transcriptional ArsR family regulator
MTETADVSAPSTFTEPDRILHEPSRLNIMALLYTLESADFIFVMNQTGLTWGNLSSHLSKLEEAGYLEIEKRYKGKRPSTNLRLTTTGRESFKQYVTQMRQLFKDLPV